MPTNPPFPATTIKSNFQTGDKPTQAQFEQFIDGVAAIDANSPLNNFTAIIDPTENDDANDGYTIGSRWVNVAGDNLFECIDNTVGAAVWLKIQTGVVGAGTVTSVGLSVPSEFTVSGSPVTNSGTLSFSKANQAANRFYAGPAIGVDAAPSFRAIVPSDLPSASLSQQGAVQLRAGQVIQSVAATSTTAVQLNVSVPIDNTIPQTTEGAEIVAVTITPTSASSILRIRAIASGTASVNASTFVPMLFRDSVANAITAGFGLISGVNGTPFTISVEGQVVAGSTSATTLRFKVGRVGGSSGWINADNAGNPQFGGANQAIIVVEEIQV